MPLPIPVGAGRPSCSKLAAAAAVCVLCKRSLPTVLSTSTISFLSLARNLSSRLVLLGFIVVLTQLLTSANVHVLRAAASELSANGGLECIILTDGSSAALSVILL